jgi:Protein of unknown function (DUF3987)/Bifunctional DNA primase/polymerase, N-terminal
MTKDMNMLEIALNYISRGWSPVPIPHRTKSPIIKEWQDLRITRETAGTYFNGAASNIGVLLGPASGGLVDVDLDCDEAIAVASYLLPATRSLFGRASAPGSHRLYMTTDADGPAVERLVDPDLAGDRSVLVEVRRGGERGAQTVFPGSMHPSGEPVIWVTDEAPPEVADNVLLRRVKLVAAAAIFARCWPAAGDRHAKALVLGGVLDRAGIQLAQAKLIAEAVAKAARDTEWRDRVTAMEIRAGANRAGFPQLAEWLGDKRAKAVATWLDYPDTTTAGGEAFGGWPGGGAGAQGGPSSQREGRNLAPTDIWGTFPAPKLPRGLLPKVIEDFAFIQGEQMGADPGGLAAAALCVCCAAIPDRVQVKVKRYDEWHESARIWVALVGPPSTKKSPLLNVAERQLRAIDLRLFRDFASKKAAYDALKKDEKSEAERPRQIRKLLDDTTIEAAAEVMADSPGGVLVTQDELSGWFGGMDRYNGGKGRERSFWLRAFNGGALPVNRIGRGAGLVENVSACVLGGIQPEPIRGVVAEGEDDGLIQRLFPIVLQPAGLGSEEAPPSDAVRAYNELVEALTRIKIDRPAGFIDVGHRPRLLFDPKAQVVRRKLEERHLALLALECINRKLAAHIGKYDGLFARLCVAFHAIENAHREVLPTVIDEDTARRVGVFLHRFFLPHALAFYGGVLNLSDDHDRLSALAGYILAHKLETVSVRDVARGDGTMRKLTRPDVVRLFEQLEALGWVAQQPTSPRVNAAPVWIVNPEVHTLFAERGEQEARQRAEVARRIAEARRVHKGGDGDEF